MTTCLYPPLSWFSQHSIHWYSRHVTNLCFLIYMLRKFTLNCEKQGTQNKQQRMSWTELKSHLWSHYWVIKRHKVSLRLNWYYQVTTEDKQDDDLPFKMVYFVCVLAAAVSVAQQWVVLKGLIFQHLDTLSPTRLILTRLGYTVQLCYLVLEPGKHKTWV